MKLKVNDLHRIFYGLKVIAITALIAALIFSVALKTVRGGLVIFFVVLLSGLVVMALSPLHQKIIHLVDAEGDKKIAEKFAILYLGIVFIIATAVISFAWSWILQLRGDDNYLVLLMVAAGVYTPCFLQFKPLVELLHNTDSGE